MGLKDVRSYFKEWDMEDEILEFDTSSATVELAALAVGCEPGRIAKSMAFMIDNKAILILLAGNVKIDNKKYKLQFSTRAKMLSKDQVMELIGHPVGGVCPFGIKDGVTVYLDKSLKQFETVYPACGSSNSAIELTLEELEKYSNYSSWVDVCKE